MAPLEPAPGTMLLGVVGTMLLCVVAPSPSLGLEEVGGADETGVFVVAAF